MAREFKAPKKKRAPTTGTEYAVSRFVQFGHIFKRAFLSNIRNKPANIIRTVQTVCIVCVCACVLPSIYLFVYFLECIFFFFFRLSAFVFFFFLLSFFPFQASSLSHLRF